MQAQKPLERALQLLPWLFGGTVAVVLALVLLKADLTKEWAAWLRVTVTLAMGLAVVAAVRSFLVPRLRARVATAGHIAEVINVSPDPYKSPLLYFAYCTC